MPIAYDLLEYAHALNPILEQKKFPNHAALTLLINPKFHNFHLSLMNVLNVKRHVFCKTFDYRLSPIKMADNLGFVQCSTLTRYALTYLQFIVLRYYIGKNSNALCIVIHFFLFS